MSDAGEVMNIALLSMSLMLGQYPVECRNSRKAFLFHLTDALVEVGPSANREG
jgi:hypothetical protein